MPNFHLKSDVILTSISVVMTFFIFFVGYQISVALKENEVELKYIDISVNILRSFPSDDQKHLRNWAIDNINEYSKIKLTSDVREELAAKPLSFYESKFSDKLRRWLNMEPAINRKILEEWLNTRNIKHSIDMFLNLNLYEAERSKFLQEHTLLD